MNSRQDPGAGPVAGSGNEQALIALLEAARTVEAHLERTLGEIDLTHAKLRSSRTWSRRGSRSPSALWPSGAPASGPT